MTVNTNKYNVKCPSPVRKTYCGRFTGINGASPTSYTLDQGCSVARTGEGVWVVTLPAPLKQFKAVSVGCTDDDGKYHAVSYTLSASARTITITHVMCTYATIVSAGPVADDVIDEIYFRADVELGDVPGSGI